MDVFWGELLGTLLLLLLGNGAVANVLLSKSKGEGSGWIVITAGWGFALAIALYAAGWVSGGHLNPAVTVAMIAIGKTPLSLLPLYLAGQFLGALLGALLVYFAYQPHWAKTEDPHLKLSCFCTRPAIRRPAANFVTEVIGTAVLLVGVLGIFDTHNGTLGPMGPYAVGILIFSLGLSLGGPTGFAINPARDFAPRLLYAWLPIPGKGSAEWNYAWIPVLGPFVGALLGAWAYQYGISSLKPLYLSL
jgi:glycerol uptake facilitator protein